MEIARLTATTRGDVVAFLVRSTTPLTMGRSSRCGIRLRDPKVSREHCCLTYFGGDLLVNDLDSAHGLLFRGERQLTFRLKVGDGFHLGRTFVRFESLDEVDESQLEPAPAPEVSRNATPDDAASGPGSGDADDDGADAPEEQDAEEAEDERSLAATRPQLEFRAGDLPIGTELGGFRIEGVIGRSDRTTVYQASQQHLQRAVALKVLRSGTNAREDASLRAVFLADMRTAAARNDSCLVAVFDVLDTPKFCAATVELVDGDCLTHRLQRGPRLAWRELVPVLADVLQGLHVIHQDRRVHGAVKPNNVFLLRKGGARLADARATPLPREQEFDAMPSPEQRARAIVDQRSDLHAVGALAWLMLAGTPPPAEPTTQALLRVEPSLPKSLAELIAERLLATNPAARPSTAQAVRNELLAGLGPAKRSSATAGSSPPPASRDRDAAPRPIARPTPSGDLSARASPGVRFAARLTSEVIVVGMILLLLIPTLVLLRRINPAWDVIAWVESLLK